MRVLGGAFYRVMERGVGVIWEMCAFATKEPYKGISK